MRMESSPVKGLALFLGLVGALGGAEANPGGLARGGFEAGAGWTRFTFRPVHGDPLELSGAFLSGRYALKGNWSLEGELRRETGRDGIGVSLERRALRFGPRYTWEVGPRLELFAHARVGAEGFEATQGLARDRRGSLSLSPGLGADLRVLPRLVLRGQVEGVLTRVAGERQGNLAFALGFAYRWAPAGPGAGPVSLPAPAPMTEAPPVSAPQPAAPSAPVPLPAKVAERLEVVPVPPPLPRGLTLRFANGCATIGEAEQAALRGLAQALRSRTGFRVRVSGHASRVGRGNRALSARRAAAVCERLRQEGVPEACLTHRAASFHEPAALGTAPEHHARNRRVEIQVLSE